MFPRAVIRCAVVLAALLCQLPASACAAGPEDAGTLAARLHTAQRNSALEDAAMTPWYLKLAVHFFDAKGNPTQDGTIEEWWSSPGHYRRRYTIAGYNATEVREGDRQYRTRGIVSPPHLVEVLRDETVNPGVASSIEDASHAELRHQVFDNGSLDCIMLSQPTRHANSAPLGLFPTYCLDPDTETLRADFRFIDQVILRDAVTEFQGKKVATRLTVLSEGAKTASAEVESLKTLPPDSPELETAGGPAALTGMAEQKLVPVKITSGAMARHVSSVVFPKYPNEAKQNHMGGLVVLRAVIGTDGRIHSLRVVSAADPNLAVSAISAVRRWTYKPYSMLGTPVDVATLVTVNYFAY